MRTIIKLLVLASLPLSANTTFAQAEGDGPIKLTPDATSSQVFQVKMPSHGVLVLNIIGNDRFSSLVDVSGVSSAIDGKTAFFQTRREGNYNVAASTHCGLAIAIAIDTYDITEENPASVEDYLPKVVIEAPEPCIL